MIKEAQDSELLIASFVQYEVQQSLLCSVSEVYCYKEKMNIVSAPGIRRFLLSFSDHAKQHV